ncbi:fimbria/pilus outer membrane usher protein [Candidatus Deferrimicrobium sp.]|uniref:fimbria/pilus outer membrane usher protein n=1 Tax=Candidatus Deferrimicrobium sp. TaxID=3060586 RepID=UPI00271E0210|nr:fimbria/pilus outer membrane usher protein [Candidatus Deferrimicrobium sp.]MDO8737510.1 fimbria/pilus outer membrane usher protein [Candidatus Deferrimicrobium sp.]
MRGRAPHRAARRRASLLLSLLLGILFLPSAARCADLFYVKVSLNGEVKGEFLVRLLDDGDFLVRTADLAAMGLSLPPGRTTEIDGEPHRSLRSLEKMSFVFREKTLSLEMTAHPSVLPRRVVDFRPPRQPKVLYPKDASGFFNYGVTWTGGNPGDAESLDVTGQVGARRGDFLFLSDAAFEKTRADQRLVRLSTNVTRDRREEMQRLVFGDLTASSGDLGTGVNLGGFGFSKVYRIDPYFLRYPLAGVGGMVSLPSEAEVYLGGTRIRTEKLSPGQFELKNISSLGGRSDVTVVIRDPFGREQTIRYPFYFAETLLDEGLHEYSYNVGFLRRKFGEESNRYGPAAFSVFHNYGLSDRVTLGGRGEGTGDGANLGPQAAFRVGDAGVVALSFAGSVRRDGRLGAAGEATHSFQGGAVSTRIFLKGVSRDYAVAAEEERGSTDGVRYEVAAGAGYGTPRMGTFSVDADFLKRHTGTDRRTVAVSYSRNIGWNVSVLGSFGNVREGETVNELMLGVNYYPGRDLSLAASYREAGGVRTETVQARKNLPAGEGWGYSASVERMDSTALSSTAVNPSVQYNARFGSYAAEYRGERIDGGGGNGLVKLSAYGGAAFVGETIGFSRPITDSFGLVSVGGLEGIRVYHNNQEMGRTDGRGKLFLPSLGSYYENQISIADKDVPIDYALREVLKVVSPPLRSGSRIPFEVKRFQAVTGTLGTRRDGEWKPAEYVEVRMPAEGKEIAFPTGKGGEFYVEDLGPGAHAASVEQGGGRCLFEMTVPATDDMIVDLGRLTCEDPR